MQRHPSALVENLEGRQMLAVSPVKILGIKIAKAVDSDGTALNQNRITIAFSADGRNVAGIRLMDPSKIRSWGYANDLTNLSLQRKVSVGLTISQSAAEPGVITILTDRLVRKGSRIFIEQGALTDTKGRDIIYDASSAATTITLNRGQNKPRYTMANRNWLPTDVNYFTPDVFASANTPATANVTPAAATIRNNLVTFLDAKISKGLINAEQKATALAIFDGVGAFSAATAIIPNANLRAGLASLVGTPGEPAIGSIIGKSNVTGKPWTTVEFNAAIGSSAPVGETKVSASNRLYTYIQPSMAGEPFQALGAVLAHEAMHQGTKDEADANGVLPSSQDEEIVTAAVETTIYAQAVLVQPTLAGNGTKLINRLNERLLALLNSGDELFPYGGIKQAPARTNDGNVFVGAKTDPGGFGDNSTVKSFADWVRREYIFRGFAAGGTTTNPTAQAILKNIVGTSGNFSLFGSQVQTYLDTRNAILTDVAYITLANALKLTF